MDGFDASCYVPDVSPLRAWVAAAFRHPPPVIRRDAKIAALQHELAHAEQKVLSLQEELSSQGRQIRRLRGEARELSATQDALTAELIERTTELSERSEELSAAILRQVQPSHRAALAQTWRERIAVESTAGLDDCRAFDHKLMSYAFAQSHEVSIPRLFGWWRSLDDVDLARLVAHPQPQMLKSAYGATAQGVAPTDDLTDLRATLESWRGLLQPSPRAGRARIAPPFFTEERLHAPDNGPLIDIKVYTFYGEIGVSMLVAAEDCRRRSTTSCCHLRFAQSHRWRSIPGPVSDGGVLDPTTEIAVPSRLAEIAETSRNTARLR
jgi:hypothetical protein